MVRRLAMLTVALWVGFGQPATAQGDRIDTVVDDVETGLDDIVHIWTSPFRVGADDLVPLLAVVGVTAATAVFDARIQNWVRTNPDALPLRLLGPFREPKPPGRLGYTRTLLPLSAAMYATGLVIDADGLREAGLGCAVSDVANTIARHGVARLIGRLRPESRRGPYRIDPLRFGEWEWRSFPGGHAANIMACTSFWTGRFELGIAEPLLYALAGLVGTARIADEAHWASDTVFGFAFGWAVGDEVADRFLARRAAGGGDRRRGPAVRIGVTVPVP